MTQALADGRTTTFLDNLVVWFRLLGRLPADTVLHLQVRIELVPYICRSYSVEIAAREG